MGFLKTVRGMVCRHMMQEPVRVGQHIAWKCRSCGQTEIDAQYFRVGA